MKFFITICLICRACCFASAQNIPPQMLDCKTWEIQEITLQDTFLVKQISLFIEDGTKADSYFAKKGYIMLSISETPYMNEKVEKSYGINKQFTSFDKLDNDSSFPPFYTLIKGRIVLVWINSFEGSICLKYTKKSKVAFPKKLEPFLAKRVRMKFPDKEGKLRRVKNFRPGEMIQFHGGKTIYIFEDKDNPPVIEKNRY